MFLTFIPFDPEEIQRKEVLRFNSLRCTTYHLTADPPGPRDPPVHPLDDCSAPLITFFPVMCSRILYSAVRHRSPSASTASQGNLRPGQTSDRSTLLNLVFGGPPLYETLFDLTWFLDAPLFRHHDTPRIFYSFIPPQKHTRQKTKHTKPVRHRSDAFFCGSGEKQPLLSSDYVNSQIGDGWSWYTPFKSETFPNVTCGQGFTSRQVCPLLCDREPVPACNEST